jgi:hypothetical protein
MHNLNHHQLDCWQEDWMLSANEMIKRSESEEGCLKEFDVYHWVANIQIYGKGM